MKKRYGVITALMMMAIWWYAKMPKEVLPEVKTTTTRAPGSSSEKKSSGMEAQKNNSQPWELQLETAGLNTQKIQALHDLYQFHQSMPEVNQQNREKREKFLQALNTNPEKTLLAFNQFMQKAQAADDELRSFIINVAMELQVSDEERAELIITRAKQGAHFDHNKALRDDELSLLIGFSHLSGMQDEQVKRAAIEEIYQQAPEDKNYQKLLRDYFPR